ncbi:MAG: OPT/YSL family transporter [Anaerovoracaceae bacterium]
MSNKQLPVRGLIIGALGSIVLTMSSMFIALKLSSVPWPIMFVVLVSMFLLKLCGNTNLQEINVTQTAMSAGAMVAGGLAFTIPGIWMLNPEAEVSLAALLNVTLRRYPGADIYCAVPQIFYRDERTAFRHGTGGR